MRQKKFWLKLIGIAILLHIVLILISILEVAIYSYLITPGKDKEFYDTHATISGPWISAIFGSLFMFFLVKRFTKRFSQQQLTYAMGLFVIYITIDLILVFASGYEFKDYAYSFVLAAVPKIVAVLLAYFIYSANNHQSRKLNRYI